MYTVTMFLALCVLLSTLSFERSDAAVAVYTTKFKEGGKFYCPKYSFVSSFVIKKGERQGDVVKDFSFYFECDLFTPPDFDDKGPERCTVRFKWTMGGYDLRMDDHFKSCSCDEYLAGVKTEWKDGERIVQFRCCFAKNKIHNISGCYFTGQRPLQADWNTEVRTKKGKQVTEGVQTFAIIDDMVIGRVCPYFVKDIDIDTIGYMTNKCSGVKQRGIKDILDKIKEMAKECKIYMGSPFGWPQSQNSLSNDKNMANHDDRLYAKQKTMCKDGSYLYAIYKFPKVGDKGKDYVFLTRCHVLVYTVCYCFWRQNCTKPEKRNTSESNKTMYVAGWRSQWDDGNARRKFEMWCCKSDGLKMSYCNLTKNYTDADTSLVIARPRYKFFAFYQPKCIDGQIIRDVDHWYLNGILQLRFNVCNINGSEGECEKPCKRCKDIDPTEQICRPPPEVPSNTSTTSSSSTSSSSSTPPPKCRADIDFLLDSSGSLTPAGFDQEKQFIRNFVSQLPLSPTDSRVGLTEFGQTAQQMWSFTSTTQSQSNIQNQINQLAYWDSSTNITGALQTVIPIFEQESRHLSPTKCVPRVAILVTDGRNNVGNLSPAVPAGQLRAMGVTLYAVGIGPDANKQDLDTITGDPGKTFMVDFDSLQQIVNKVLQAACSEQQQKCVPTATATTPPTRDHSQPAPGCRSEGEGNICSQGQGGGITNNPNNPANTGAVTGSGSPGNSGNNGNNGNNGNGKNTGNNGNGKGNGR